MSQFPPLDVIAADARGLADVLRQLHGQAELTKIQRSIIGGDARQHVRRLRNFLSDDPGLWPVVPALADNLAAAKALIHTNTGIDHPGPLLLDLLDLVVLQIEGQPKAKRRPRNGKHPDDPRDKWIYEECMKGTPFGQVRTALKKKIQDGKKWTLLSPAGIKRAANRYAGRKGLPPLPSRRKPMNRTDSI